MYLKTWVFVVFLVSMVGLLAGEENSGDEPSVEETTVLETVEEILSPKDLMARLAYANNNFGLALHRKLAEDDGNVFFSPFSVSSVLTMLYRGSRGETANELRKLLRYEKFLDSTVFSGFKYYLSEILDKVNTKQYVVKCVSAMIVDNAFPVLPEYKTAVQDIFQAFVEGVNITEESALVVDRMNTWAKIKTKGAITKLAEYIHPDTTIFLASAAYFKGNWKMPFNPNNTKDHPFYNGGDMANVSDILMMHAFQKVHYFEYEERYDFRAVELKYEGKNVSMVILLPDQYDGLKDMEENMTATTIESIRNMMIFTKTHLTMPKFKLQTDYSLSRPLRELGFKRIFMPGANLSDMIPEDKDLILDDVEHKATIEVNEEGSVAKAITRGIMMKSLPVEEETEPEFKVDHPFLFAIFDTRNKLILFMGRVNNFLEDVAIEEIF